MAAAIPHRYEYLEPSGFVDGTAPALRLATSGGAAAHPYFFEGELCRPRQTAVMLRSLMDVVQTRFHTPAAMLLRILALADPVVTASEDRLRFEAFSGCASVYARVDLDPEVAPGDYPGRGTTNVDFGPAMLGALARVRADHAVGLSVGTHEVGLHTASESVVEKKVALPLRWLRSFVEVQAHLARMDRGFEVAGAGAARFLRGLPRSSTAKRTSWIVPSGPGLRLSQRETAGAVPVVGLERLRVLENLAADSETLRVYADPRTGASAWELDFAGARFQLALSPEVWRGFSGEGQVLETLASREGDAMVNHVHGALRWETRLDIDELAQRLELTPTEIQGALARLGARGLVGYDLRDGAYFHRELPYDLTTARKLQKRLVAAEKLVEDDRVQITTRGPNQIEAYVASSDVHHRVVVATAEDASKTCTCPWFAKHQGDRGPCKHVLAVQLVLERESVK